MMLLMLATVSATAQEKPWSKWTVTPRIGMTVSNYQEEGKEYIRSGVGFAVGADVEYRLSNKVGLSLGAFYSTHKTVEDLESLKVFKDYHDAHGTFYEKRGKGESLPTIEEDANDGYRYIHEFNRRHEYRYLSIPVVANFHAWKGLTLKAGIQMDYLMGAHAMFTTRDFSIHRAVNVTDRQDYYVDYNIGVKDKSEKILWSVPVGVSWEYKDIEVDMRYSLGLKGILKDADENVKPQSLMITIGYKLH